MAIQRKVGGFGVSSARDNTDGLPERKARIAEQDAIREAKFLEEIKRQNEGVI